MVNIIAATEVLLISLLLRRFFNLKEKQRGKITDFLCLCLLLFNLTKYISQSVMLGRLSIPVEFSAVAYFLVPAIIILRITFLRVWAVYSSLLAGSGYFFVFSLFGSKIYENYSVDKIISALICHGILLFIGLSQLSFKKFSVYSGWILTVGLCFCVFHALNMSSVAVNLRGVFMYELIFGFAAVDLFGKMILPFYYFLVFTVFSFSFFVFYKLNSRFAKK